MSYVSTRQSAEALNRAKACGVREGRSLPFSALGEDEGARESSLPASRFNPKGRWAEPPAEWHEETPEALLQRAETRAAHTEAIATLPDNYRLVLTLRDIEGLDVEDLCRLLEISEANQRVLLHRARSKVRQAIEARLAGR